MADFYEEKEMNEAEEITGNKKKNKLPVIITGGAIAVILAVIAYWILISAENAVLNKNSKVEVYVMSEDMAKGTQLIDASVFIKKEVNSDVVPANAVTDISKLKDTYAIYDISKNTVITENMFRSKIAAENGTREISFDLASLAGSVNGTIRASDYIDLYILTVTGASSKYADAKETADTKESESETSGYIIDNKEKESQEEVVESIKKGNVSIKPTYTHIYVTAAYTADGVLIANNDTESKATRFTIVVPEADADYIIGAYSMDNTVFYATKWTDKAVNEAADRDTVIK